jgi:lipopolysaccharide/colanic/teichoic acid biosynthesis glycosyltransferase
MRNQAAKRAYDFFFAAIGLLLLSPLFGIIAALVKCSDGGPVFFRQQRVGQNGALFRIWKFRTMIVGSEKKGLSVTRDGDSRITRVGWFLRKTKLDELPQLLNVIRGEMSLVGPRPEVPCYVACYSDEQRAILSLKPGITDLATLEFRHEEELLRSASDVEAFYLQSCVPRKIELNQIYARQATLWTDTVLILKTLFPRSKSTVGNSESDLTLNRQFG